MAETTGTVGLVKVNATPAGNFGMVQVLDASTSPPKAELFFVWIFDTTVPTGPQWMWRAMQLSLLREALTSGKTVTVFHDDTSAYIRSVQINA
jgi:hypothetical protein